MRDKSYLDWPFFDAKHRALAAALEDWAARHLPGLIDHRDIDGSCRALVAALGKDRWLDHAVPGDSGFDLRSLCLIREILASHSALADFAFAMQGLGTGAITLFGTPAQKAALLNGARSGKTLTAFALSEPEAGSDVAAMKSAATPAPGGFELTGIKCWISNGGIAGQYIVFARDEERYTAFAVAGDNPGLSIVKRQETISPHPLAMLEFRNCRVREDAVIGGRGN